MALTKVIGKGVGNLDELGVGTASPSKELHVQKASSGGTATSGSVAVFEDDDNTEISLLGGSSSILAINFGHSGDADDGIISYNTTGSSEAMMFFVSAAERMRLLTDGNILLGTSSTDGNGGLTVDPNADGDTCHLRWNKTTSSSTGALILNQSGSYKGGISYSSSGTTFNTSSDYRLKENVVTDWDATTRLKQLKPSRFNFKTDKDKTVDGFLAHEVSSIVPEAITGEKDAVDSDGNPIIQGIDQSKLVPLLVKTIQELEARIAALEAK